MTTTTGSGDAATGEMAVLIRDHAWARTPLGPAETWSASLRTIVRMLSTAGFPMVALWGPDLVQIYNDGYRVLMGGKHPAGLGQPTRACWPEVWHINEPIYARVLAGETLTFEDKLFPITRHGVLEEAWFTLGYSPLRDDADAIAGILVTVFEVTRQVRAAETLRRSEARMHELLAQAPSFVAILAGPEHRFEFVNDAYRRLIGGRDVVGKTVREALPEIKGQGFYELLDGVYASGERYVGRGRRLLLQTAEAGPVREVFLDFIYQPMRDAAGAVSGIFVQGHDVTDAHQAQEALQRLNERLEERVAEALAERRVMAEIVESTDAFIQVLDEDFRFLALNAANAREYERIYGFRPRVGDSLLDYMAGSASLAKVRAVWSRALAGEAFTEITELGDEALDRRVYEMIFRPLHGPDGRVVGAYHISRDITQRLRDEAKLAEAEERLRLTQKMEAIGQLTGGVAHDFNNLLQVVTSGLERLDRREDPQDRRRIVDAMRQAVERGTGLTRQLLAFSRRQALRPEPVDLTLQLSRMGDLLDRSLGEGVGIEMATGADTWPVEVDPGELELALLNLCLNARDAMPAGGTITLAAANVQAPATADLRGDFVRLSVADQGTGMVAEVAARACEPFFTTKEAGKGSGLGLAQVYGFAKQSGGAVEIDSAPGRGTTVVLLLPRSRGQPASDGPRPGAIDGSEGQDGAALCGQVLLVEDDREVAALTAEMLAAMGLEVIHVASVAAALGALADERPVDLVFSDIMMPGGASGLDLAREVRRRRPELPVVLTTGNPRSAEGADGLGVDLILKPYRAADLRGLLRTHLAGGEHRAGA